MPKVRELPADLIKEWAAKHAAANAKLEGRELPDGFIRSVQAQQFLNMRKPGSSVRYGRSVLNADGSVATVLYDD